MYKDDREIEKLIENKSHPLPQIVDIDDLQDDLYNVIDINCEREYTDEEIDESLSILDIVKYCIVSKIRLSVMDYDNSVYCSYDPNVFRAIHKKISGNIKHTILVRVENNHAYFITDKNLKTSISVSITNVRLDYVNSNREDLQSKNKKLEVGLEPVDIEYHTTYPLDTDGMPMGDLYHDEKDKDVEVIKGEILKMVKYGLSDNKAPPQPQQLKDWANGNTYHHYYTPKSNLNGLVDLLYNTYGMKPTSITGTLTTIQVATYEKLKIYSQQRRPKLDKNGEYDKVYKLYPDIKSKYGVLPTPTRIAQEIYKQLELKPSIDSMLNSQTRSIFL